MYSFVQISICNLWQLISMLTQSFLTVSGRIFNIRIVEYPDIHVMSVYGNWSNIVYGTHVMEADSEATLQWQGEEFPVPKSLLEDVRNICLLFFKYQLVDTQVKKKNRFLILVYYFVEGSFYRCGIT